MRPIRVLAAVLSLALAACGSVHVAQPPASSAGSGGLNRADQQAKPHLILISFDGFKPDYLDRFDLPNFKRVIARGTRARAMIPVFPSLTFPNHYSLVTGLTAERHGIVGNSFFDPGRNAAYSFRNETVGDGTWYRGEPIWVTAETQGMVAACFFWPGSEAAIKGVRPTIWNKYDAKVGNDERVATVLDWLRLAAERRPHLVTLYFSELDSASHQNPLDSPAIARAAESVDRALGALLDGVERLPIRDRVYLLLTSDHGMVDTSAAQTIMLGSILDASEVRVGFTGPVTSLHVTGGGQAAARIRDRLNDRLKNGRAYLRAEIPEAFRFKRDPRIGDVLVVMDESWTLTTTPPLTGIIRERWGMHGWDPALPSMHALFLIAGPDIPGGATIPAVNNVDVYPLMTELLGLAPAQPLDGRTGHVRRLIAAASR